MTVPHPSEWLIRQRLAALTKHLPSARTGDVTAIHQARVATRRLREALPLVAHGRRARKLTKRIRRLTRALGSVRELDVALLTLDELQAEAAEPSSGITCLRQVVADERQRLRADMVRQLGRVNIEKFEKKAMAVAHRDRPEGTQAGRRDPRRLMAASRRAARRAMTLRATVENAGGIYLPDRLHQVRIAVKKLRYAMEITRDISRSRAIARLRTLKTVQDLLGRMHDLEVLIMRVRALQGSEHAPTLRVSADLDRLVRRLETECRQLHVRYVGFKTALHEVCDYVTALDEAA
jgi:CHAD domain-containing protein